MILIRENGLIQVDTTGDVLEHYGVKGMKWGVRKARDVVSKVGNIHRKNLEYKYYKKYGDKDVAKQKADKRYKIDKAIAGTAAAAATAYGAYKLGKYVRDEYIGQNLKGRTLATMTIGDLDNKREFFASQGGDIARYRRNWGAALTKYHKKNNLSTPITQNFNKVTGTTKIAPNRVAYQAFKKAIKNDPEYFKYKGYDFREKYDPRNVGARMDISKGKVTKKTYDMFIRAYKKNDPKVLAAFQKELKKRGYAGIIDKNDAGGKTEVYARNSPVILFEGKKRLKRVATKEYKGNTAGDTAMRIVDAAPELAKNAIKVAGAYGLAKSARTTYKRKTDTEYNKKQD